jgi:hypothetical protein
MSNGAIVVDGPLLDLEQHCMTPAAKFKPSRRGRHNRLPVSSGKRRSGEISKHSLQEHFGFRNHFVGG